MTTVEDFTTLGGMDSVEIVYAMVAIVIIALHIITLWRVLCHSNASWLFKAVWSLIIIFIPLVGVCVYWFYDSKKPS